MNPLLKKLNFKAQNKISIINAPENFGEQINDFKQYLEVETSAKASTPFCLLFVTEQDQVDTLAPIFDKLLDADGLFWWAYPKGSSKKYKSQINRDSGWQIMGDLGYEPVRMVAIDEDWSAFRFRKAILIKKLTRDENWRMSEDGKKK